MFNSPATARVDVFYLITHTQVRHPPPPPRAPAGRNPQLESLPALTRFSGPKRNHHSGRELPLSLASTALALPEPESLPGMSCKILVVQRLQGSPLLDLRRSPIFLRMPSCRRQEGAPEWVQSAIRCATTRLMTSTLSPGRSTMPPPRAATSSRWRGRFCSVDSRERRLARHRGWRPSTPARW